MNERLLANVYQVLRMHLSEVCIEHPGQRVTITYGAVAVRAAVGSARAVTPYLNRIARECESRHEPSLDCLVINQRKGKPGGKWLDADVWNQEIRRCVDWASGLVH